MNFNKLNNSLRTSTLLLLSVLLGQIVIGQTWTHDFESGAGVNYTTSDGECISGASWYDYFTHTDGTGLGDPVTGGVQGSNYFAAQDIDAPTCPAIDLATNIYATVNFNAIDISGCSGLSLQVLCASPSNHDGWDDPDYVHFMYRIDGGAWTNLLWFEGAGGTNVDTREDTNFNGTGNGTTLDDSFQNFTKNITGTGSTLDIEVRIKLNSAGEDFCFDNLRVFGTGCGGVNTITTGVITGAPFDVECNTNTTDNGTVAFTSVGTFLGGNVFTAQLSDAIGSFASPIDIGTLTLSGVDPSGNISFTIPETMAQGAGYLIRVISDAPSTIGSSSAAFTINQNDPCLPSVAEGLIINEWSNGNSGNEEYYEFVVAGECGTSIDIRNYILDDNNGTFSNPIDYNNNPNPNPTGIAPGHFRFTNDAQWASVPVGSLIVVYNADEPNGELPADDPTDFDNDSLYVVPHNSSLFERCTSMPDSPTGDSTYTPCTYAQAPITGWGPLSLRNDGDAIQVRNPDGSYYHGVSYGGSEITGGPHNLKLFTGDGTGMCGWFNDGDFFDVANWSSGTADNTTQTPGEPNNAINYAWLKLMRDPAGATCPITVLPVELISFEGVKTEKGNVLLWSTITETNSNQFYVERSIDGKNWERIGSAPAAGNSQSKQNYQLVDFSFEETINYYRLLQIDFDGAVNNFNHIVVLDNRIELDNGIVGRYNLMGQEVDENYDGVQIILYQDGTTERILNH